MQIKSGASGGCHTCVEQPAPLNKEKHRAGCEQERPGSVFRVLWSGCQKEGQEVTDLVASLLGALVTDVATNFQSSVASTIGAVGSEFLGKVMKRRTEAVREIMISELKLGDRRLTDLEIEESAAIVYRYARAAEEGTARVNLRLLAAVFAGQVRRKPSGHLIARRLSALQTQCGCLLYVTREKARFWPTKLQLPTPSFQAGVATLMRFRLAFANRLPSNARSRYWC